MKKIRNLALVFACMLMAVLMGGCNNPSLTASFNQKTIQIEMGQEYDPYSFIDAEIDANTKNHITFKSGNNQIAFVTAQKKLVAVSEGSTALFCYYDNKQFAYCFVEVLEQEVQYNAPVNISFDTTTNCITWNYVYAQSAQGIIAATTYTVEITKNNGIAREYQAIGNTYGPMSDFGSYKIRVKANSSSKFLASDYAKNTDGEYKYFEFNLMGTPNTLNYDKETEMFSWNANGNPENTSYKVFVNGTNIAGLNGTTETSIVIPTSVVGTYSVFIEVLPLENYYPAKSKTIILTQLASPVLAFENGILSWSAITNAKNYQIILKNNGTAVGQPIIVTETQTDLSAVLAGEYVAEVIAIGDNLKYIYNSAKSTYIFEKIETAELQFNTSAKTFSILNNSGYVCKIYVTNQTTQEQTIIENTSYVWNITTFDTYSISAKFFANDETTQIDGNNSNGFILNDENSTQLNKIKNLQKVNMQYSESEGNSYIQINELDENSNYSLWLNNNDLDLTLTNFEYNIGLTFDIFTNSGIYNFDLKINKDIQDSTIFISTSSQIAVEKIAAPLNLGLSGNNVIITDTELDTDAIVSTKVVINDVITQTLNMANSAWEIKVNFVANSGSIMVDNTKTYYTSSNVSTFNLRRLSNIENLSYTYITQIISWDAVPNVGLYHIFIDGQEIDTTTETQYLYETVGNKSCKLVATPEIWESITINETGYFQSFESEVLNIYQSNAMTNLTLSLNDGIVTANWVAPNNNADLDLTYNVFIGEYPIIENISTTTYTFDSAIFENAGSYRISVKMTCPNNDYFLPTENEISVNLTRLFAPQTLNRNVNNLSVVGFNSAIMTGVSFNEETYSENDYSIAFINDGQSVALKVFYLGTFDHTQNKYYLNSDVSTFNIRKLNIPQNLYYEDKAVYWNSLDSDIASQFYYNFCINVGSTTTPPATTTQTQVENLNYDTEFAFIVYEELISNWASINVNETKFLPSNNIATLYVVKENTISNLEMDLTAENNIKILWNYSERLTDVADYRTNFSISLISPNDPTYTFTQTVADTLEENGKYYYVFDKTSFDDSGAYAISVKAISNKTLDSSPQVISITKLAKIEHISLVGTTATLLNSDLQPISMTGVSNISVGGNLSTINGLQLDLSAMTSGENWSVNIALLAILPEDITNKNYYLNSDVTEYKFVKISDLTPVIDGDNNRITWVARENATSYSVRVEKAGGIFEHIQNISENYLSLTDSRLLQITAESGTYQISVKANVSDTTLTPFIELNNSPIGYIESNYTNSVKLNKLQDISTPVITTETSDLTQTEVTITWNTIQNATNYDIYVSSTRGIKGTLLATVDADLVNPTISYATNTFNSAGTYFVGVIARGNSIITSNLSDQVKIVRLDSITSGYIDETSCLSWVETSQIASLLYDYSYYFATYDNNDQMIEQFGNINPITDNFYSLSDNVWINGLDGQNLKIKITILGNGTSNGTSEVATLSSGIYQIEAYKFIEPTITIENNAVNITSADSENYASNIKFVYSIQSGEEIKIDNADYTDSFDIPQSWLESGFTITAYATISADDVSNQNLIKSNIATLSVDRLAQATGLVVSVSDELNLEQNSVDISWNAVENATSYDIYIDDTYQATINAVGLETDFIYTAEDLFTKAGSYQVKILAKAPTFVNSLFSESVTVVRLNSITYGYMGQDKTVNWTSETQLNSNYTFYLELLSESGDGYQVQAQSLSSLTELTYAGFATNQWLSDFEGGNFAIKVKVIGNGSSSSLDGVATLSSADFNFVVLKLFNPLITINPDYLTISFEQGDLNVPGTGTIATNSHNVLSVLFGEEFAKYGSDLDIDNIVYNQEAGFYYPDTWAEGVYTIKSFSKPNANTFNIIPSNLEELTTTRLAAPTGLKFYRETLTDTTNYSNDGNLLDENYLSDKIYFSFSSVDNCSTYSLANGNQSYSSNFNDILVDGQFENILEANTGLKTLKITAIGTGGLYINSAPSEISFYRLSKINSFETTNGQVSWNLQENVNNFLIRNIDSVNATTKYWQSENGTINTSILTGILDAFVSGQLTLNIKAIGNITAASDGSGTIILDSGYLDNNTAFYKLRTADNLRTYLGFLVFDKIVNAENYVAKVYNSEDLLLQTISLGDYSIELQYSDTTTDFVGFSNSFYGLQKETLYKIKIQAQSTAPETIFSDLSSVINIKILENANALSSNISLMKNPNGDLTQTLITAYASQNSYGLLERTNNTISIGYQVETPYAVKTLITMPTVVIEGGMDRIYAYASLGSSSIEEGGFYYLTSSFTTSSAIHVLAKTEIWVDNGTIFWDEIENADGYYVYVGENLYQTEIYTETYLDFGDMVFEENAPIDISIVGVSNSLYYLYGPRASYQFEYSINGTIMFEDVNLYKTPKPVQLSIIDGALVWTDGITNLDSFNPTDFYNLINFVRANPGKENLQTLQDYLINTYLKPVLFYSEYLGFTNPSLILTFENTLTGLKYNVETTADKLLKLSALQQDNMLAIKSICLSFADEMLGSLTPTSPKDLYSFGGVEFENQNDFWYSYFSNLKAIFESDILTNLIDLYENEIVGWPNIDTLFGELNNQSSKIPGGSYNLTIVQKGNDLDWLKSPTSVGKSIYIPNAVNGVEIKEENGDYLLYWNEVFIPVEYNYTPLSEKYIIYGEDASGNRVELLRTNGYEGTTQNSLYYNLSTLVDSDVLGTDIIKIFIVVAGDSDMVVSGLKSTELSIVVLPEVSPYMENGYLTWNSLVSASEYEIFASAEGYQDLLVRTEYTSWVGDESELEVGVSYAFTLRPLGYVYDNDGTKSYVISGKKVDFNLSKLAPMNVKVNIYGVFEWDTVANSKGFILDFEGTATRYIQYDNGTGTFFESKYYGYNKYMFRTLGTTSTISSSTLYYLSSRINASENGILGSTLSSVDRVWIEDGLIKWTPLLNDNSNSVAGMTKVIGYRLTIDNGIGKIFTTDLTLEEYFTDIDGNWCFDFTDYGTENNYNISIQAFVYYENSNTSETETATIYIESQDNDYYLLLGETLQIPFAKIAPPVNLSIVDGQVVWIGIEGYSYVVSIYNELDQQVYSELVDTEKWWSDTPLLSSDVNYKIKIKSYLENCVFSAKTAYRNVLTAEDILFAKLETLDVNFDTDNNGESNIISFAYESQSFDIGFNIRYKTSIDGEYKYFDIYNPQYNNVITYLNNEVLITVNNLELDLEEMYYSIQIVPLGEKNYLKSNWSTEVYYSTPAPVEEIYYDNENYVYYWADSTYGFVLKDQVLNEENETIAIYYYKIANGDHTTQNYYSLKTVLIDNVSTTIGTISYMPSVVGYNHKISVAVCLNPFAEKTLLSPYCESEVSTFDLFNIGEGKDLFADSSSLYLESTQLGIENYLKNNAVGTVGNPYLINNSTDLAHLNYRLTRYSYTYSYMVEYIASDDVTEITATVTEENTNYCFIQTQNITGVEQFVGITKTISGGELIYKGFGNTYDGQNYTITYSILVNINTGKLGLFNVLESTGIIRNLNVIANIDFNANANASYIYGGIVGYNLGYIYNTEVLTLSMANIIDANNNGLIGLTFGGIVGENAGGTIELSVLNNIDLPIYLSANGTNIYAGGIAGKNSGTILKCGNNANISLGKQPTIYVGGITGFNAGNILQSYNKGLIEETVTMSNTVTYMGGIAGYNNNTGYIQNSYNVATISGNTSTIGIINRYVYFGGLVGYSQSVSIKNCFSTMPATSTSGFIYSGTLIGYLSVAIPTATATTQYNYYISDNAIGYISSGSISNFAIKLTASALMDYADELNAVAEATIFTVGTNYPKFLWEN